LFISNKISNFAPFYQSSGHLKEKMKLSHVVWEKERIVQQDIIIEEVHTFPAYQEAFQTESLTVCLCLRGSASFRYDMHPREMRPHCMGVILPFHMISDGQWTDDYTTLLIVVSAPLYSELITRESFKDYIKYGNNPDTMLDENRFGKMTHLMATIRDVSADTHPKRKEMLANLLDILFYELSACRGDEARPTKNRNEQLYSRFYDLLIAHYRQHHEIGWYAEQLCLTPKYFSVLIRQTTGKSAAEWINTVLVMQAKKLLLSRRDLTVQQVAYELGFNENATFCRFFKDQTALTPSEYRQGLPR
jgi:AraC-like DNA-binding protein